MNLSLILSVLLLGGFVPALVAGEVSASVQLYRGSKRVPMAEPDQVRLLSQALRLLESSNFHSGPRDRQHVFKQVDLHQAYRTEVGGDYLLVSFPAPRTLSTVGGEIKVLQIVIGLNRADYASNLFTIDDTGAVVGHAKYSGEICIEILKLVKELTNGA